MASPVVLIGQILLNITIEVEQGKNYFSNGDLPAGQREGITFMALSHSQM